MGFYSKYLAVGAIVAASTFIGGCNNLGKGVEDIVVGTIDVTGQVIEGTGEVIEEIGVRATAPSPVLEPEKHDRYNRAVKFLKDS